MSFTCGESEGGQRGFIGQEGGQRGPVDRDVLHLRGVQVFDVWNPSSLANTLGGKQIRVLYDVL
eukprot:4901383-Pyramimonas_sp.AAC.2